MHASMRPLIRAAACAAALLSAVPADAATVTNRDTKDYKLTIIEGDKSKDHVLKPAGILPDVCPKGCVIRLNDSENDEYELEGTEVVSIEEGYLYYDVPDSMPETPAPDGKKPDEKK